MSSAPTLSDPELLDTGDFRVLVLVDGKKDTSHVGKTAALAISAANRRVKVLKATQAPSLSARVAHANFRARKE